MVQVGAGRFGTDELTPIVLSCKIGQVRTLRGQTN